MSILYSRARVQPYPVPMPDDPGRDARPRAEGARQQRTGMRACMPAPSMPCSDYCVQCNSVPNPANPRSIWTRRVVACCAHSRQGWTRGTPRIVCAHTPTPALHLRMIHLTWLERCRRALPRSIPPISAPIHCPTMYIVLILSIDDGHTPRERPPPRERTAFPPGWHAARRARGGCAASTTLIAAAELPAIPSRSMRCRCCSAPQWCSRLLASRRASRRDACEKRLPGRWAWQTPSKGAPPASLAVQLCSLS